MTRGTLLYIAVGTVLALLVGCATGPFAGGPPPPVPYARGECPTFLISYIPYPTARQGRQAVPVPDYHGWTDERMERDLRRLRDCGVDGLVLRLDAAILSDGFRTERLARFVRMADAGPSPLLLLPCIAGAPGLAALETSHEDLHVFLRQIGLLEAGVAYREAGRPLVLMTAGVRATGAPHPGLAVVQIGSDASGWRIPAWNAADRLVASPSGQTLVHAGWRGDSALVDKKGRPAWALPRARGATLVAELRTAFDARSRIIWISSWNDFGAGDFVEPNDMDGDAVYRLLQAEIRRVRSACTP